MCTNMRAINAKLLEPRLYHVLHIAPSDPFLCAMCRTDKKRIIFLKAASCLQVRLYHFAHVVTNARVDIFPTLAPHPKNPTAFRLHKIPDICPCDLTDAQSIDEQECHDRFIPLPSHRLGLDGNKESIAFCQCQNFPRCLIAHLWQLETSRRVCRNDTLFVEKDE